MRTEDQTISSSQEDYLETILFLMREHTVARSRDIGQQLQVNRSSVTSALQGLARKGLVNYSPYDFVTLTEKGQKAAEDVAQRHMILREFLEKVLRVEPAEADASACRLEHALSSPVMQRLAEFLEFVNRCPEGVADWEKSSGFHCPPSRKAAGCQQCESKRKKH